MTLHRKTVYLLLDTGFASSLITKSKYVQLGLDIFLTTHKSLQVDREFDLKVIGKVHTTFTCGSTKLSFSALVVDKMGTPILASTNLHVENDISSRMAACTMNIGNHQTIQVTSLTILSRNQYYTRSRIVNIPN